MSLASYTHYRDRSLRHTARRALDAIEAALSISAIYEPCGWRDGIALQQVTYPPAVSSLAASSLDAVQTILSSITITAEDVGLIAQRDRLVASLGLPANRASA